MKKFILFSATVFLLSNLCAQDQILLNPHQALIRTNSSFAGSNGSFRNQFVMRSSGTNLNSGNFTFYNGIDAYVKKLHGGLALSAMIVDQENGTYRNSDINLVYAPIFECRETGFKIIPSIQLTYLHRMIDYTKVRFSSVIREGALVQWPSHIPPKQTKENIDASAGLLINYKNFYAGGTIFHLNQPDVGLLGANKLPARFSFNASYNISLNEKTLFNFSSVFNNQNSFNSLQLALNAIFMKHVLLGLGYVSNDLVFVNFGYRNNFFSINLGYDVVANKLAGNTSGSYQLALAVSLHKKANAATLKGFENW